MTGADWVEIVAYMVIGIPIAIMWWWTWRDNTKREKK